ncbi:DUF6712 family protein [Jiulongibacter sp. NS-SX5]|uniref:DUF6712 family protein n=1 Tax=Jiulongibacter sp. NS-SX5 TaxID=3463854 RepID=UPI004058613A
MIFKDINQLSEYIGGIQNVMHFETFKPFVSEAEEFFVKDSIGKDLLDTLSDFVTENDVNLGAATDKEKEAIHLLRMSVAGYVDFVGSYRLVLTTGDGGKTMFTPPNSTAPTKWATLGGMEAALSRGDTAMERLLVYLESNADDFDSWTESDFYTILKGCYVRTATKLTEAFPFAKNSRRLFLGLSDGLKKAQGSYLNSIIGADFNKLMITRILADDLSEAETELLDKIATVVSLKAVADSVPYLNINEHWRLVSQFDGYGNQAVLPESRRNEISLQVEGALELAKNELTKYLQDTASAEVFPEYFNSSLYESRAESGTSSRFVNKKERKYAVL